MQMIHDQYQKYVKDDAAAKELAEEILGAGHAILPDFLTPEVWQKLQALVEDRSQANTKNEQLKGTIAYELGHSDDVFNFSEKLHQARERIEGKAVTNLDPQKQVIGLPYKDARGGQKNPPTHYHFDGAYVNIIIPIVLPEDQEKSGGGLVAFPNIRKKYGVFLSKFICRLLRHSGLMRNLWNPARVTYQLGACHVFYGDITFHGVDPIKEGERIVMTINSHW